MLSAARVAVAKKHATQGITIARIADIHLTIIRPGFLHTARHVRVHE
jgi:hypothetical protein